MRICLVTANLGGIDCQKLLGVDLVCDCNERIPLQDSCAEEINATDFLEHVRNDKRIHIMEEIHRLLKPGGRLVSLTPNAALGEGAFQDPTHTAFWTKNSFLYYTDDHHRNLYGIKAKFLVERLEVIPINKNNVSYVRAILVAVK